MVGAMSNTSQLNHKYIFGDSCVLKSIDIKDSCDGSGLNTSENSKDSHP